MSAAYGQLLQAAFPDLYQPAEASISGADGQEEQLTVPQAAAGSGADVAPGAAATTHAQQLKIEEELHRQQRQQQYGDKIKNIVDKFDGLAAGAQGLQQYVRATKEQAVEDEVKALEQADKDYTPGWRKAGLPSKASHLSVDAGKMSSAGLVNSKSLIGQYKQLQAKEVLMPPKVFTYSDRQVQPNYLQATGNQKVRATLAAERLTSSHRSRHAEVPHSTWNTLPAEELKQKLAAVEQRQRTLATSMPAAQWELEQKIIQRMFQRLAFLRNPRHALPPAVASLAATMTPHKTLWLSTTHVADDSNTPFGQQPARSSRSTPPIKSQLTSVAGAVFVAEPPEVVWDAYEAGRVVVRTVRVRNVTNVMRSLRVLPPSSTYFHVSLPRFPTAANDVAPGMYVDLTVTFTPDSLADYDDTLIIDTPAAAAAPAAALAIPLLGRRPPPQLTLPQTLDCGVVLACGKRCKEFAFANHGGAGRFRVVPAQLWPDGLDAAPLEAATIGAFSLSPLLFDLAPGSQAALAVEFAPRGAGPVHEELVMVCDNCQVKRFRLQGSGSDVAVSLVGIDGRGVDASGDASLWFGEVVPGSSTTRELLVRNSTVLPFPFHWQFSHVKSASDDNSLREAQSQVAVFSGQQQQQQEEHDNVQQLINGNQQPSSSSSSSSSSITAQAAAALPGFCIEPASGVMQPRELLQFTATFAPSSISHHWGYARLLVSRALAGGDTNSGNNSSSGSQDSSSISKTEEVIITEVGLEGLGAPCQLAFEPSVVTIPGQLMRGERTERTIELHNPSAAPGHFTFSGTGSGVSVSPAAGAVPPFGSMTITVTIEALAAGRLQAALQCTVLHGSTMPLLVTAAVCDPPVEILSSRMDFGLVRIGDSAVCELELANSGWAADADWVLEQLPSHGQAQGSGLQLMLEPSSGTLPPNGLTPVHITCTATVPGSHCITLRCSSGRGTHTRCLEAHVTVVVPNVVLDTTRLELARAYTGVPEVRVVRLRNTALLPCDYRWSVEEAYGNSGVMSMDIQPAAGRLDPGQEVETRVMLDPTAVGLATLYGVCHMDAMPQHRGFQVSAHIEGIQVAYQVATSQEWQALQQEQQHQQQGKDLARLASHHQASTSGHAPLPAPCHQQQQQQQQSQRLAADFGQVDMGATAQRVVIITNLTSMASPVSAWLQTFGVDPPAHAATLPRSSSPSGRRMLASPQPNEQQLTIGMRSAQQLSATRRRSGGATSATRVSSHHSARTGVSLHLQPHAHWAIKLSDGHESTAPFTANSGNSMMATRRQQQEATTALDGRGMALAVEPGQAVLGPWGQLALVLTAYNDMCGDYVDTLHVQVGDLPVRQVPVRVQVVGSPLLLQKERVLLPGLRNRSQQQSMRLAFGQLPAGVELDRQFWVFNAGCMDMDLSWQLKAVTNRNNATHAPTSEPPPASAAVDSTDTAGVSAGNDATTAVAPAEALPEGTAGASETTTGEGASNSVSTAVASNAAREGDEAPLPFSIHPMQQLIPAGGSVQFAVRFSSRDCRVHQCVLEGVQRIVQQRQVQEAQQQEQLAITLWASDDADKPVACVIPGIFHPHAAAPPVPLPALTVDLQAAAVAALLEPDANTSLSWNCFSIHPPDTHPSYRHTISLSNVLGCPLAFRLKIDGPFGVVSAVPSVAQDPDAFRGTVGAPSSLGQLLCLPPRESVDVTVRFDPPGGGSSRAGCEQDDYALSGALVVAFDNQQEQVLPLEASVSMPSLSCSPAALKFGAVHPQAPKPLEFVLSNSTLVDAKWHIEVMKDGDSASTSGSTTSKATKGGGTKQLASTSTTSSSNSSSIASFGAFTVSPAHGVIPGRGLGMPQKQRVCVTFAPTDNSAASVRLHVAVAHGRNCSILAAGQGTYDETQEFHANMHRI